ncbi:AgrD family cyclic lactone autoinducer peptide [Paenibacillus ginsengarvi]|uniref:AgrD family cyclic lactone autoinducer peptide n=1 Tax=Paenibacillus ginsengarvi TaxID=400777 RepID=UPI0011C48B1A
MPLLTSSTSNSAGPPLYSVAAFAASGEAAGSAAGFCWFWLHASKEPMMTDASVSDETARSVFNETPPRSI